MCFASKKVLSEIDFAFWSFRNIRKIKSRHPEHLTRAFTIVASNDRCVNPTESALIEKLMNCHRKAMTNASNRAECVRARPQVRDLAQVLKRMRLGLNRIRVWVFHPTNDFNFARLQFD